jgi:hypothetical protein
MGPAERAAAILNHIRINEVQECVLHQSNILQAMARDNLAQTTANMASLSAQISGGVHGFVAGGSRGGYSDHPLKTQYVIREFRMDRATWSGLNAMIGTLKIRNVELIRLSVQNHTLYGHRVCCFAACDDIDDLVNMWSVLNFATIFLSVHSADASTREELSNFAIDPFCLRENVEKQEKVKLSPVSESAAKLLVLYFKGTSSCCFGSFMAEAITFHKMLLDLFGADEKNFASKIALKNLDLILSSTQVIYCSGPGFVNFGAKPVMVDSSGLLVGDGSFFADESDELADAAAKKAVEGSYLERLIGKLYIIDDASGSCSEGLLVASSAQWDGKAFQFDSAKFGCFYTAVLRQRLVVSDQVAFDGDTCKVPSITSQIVPKGRRSFEVARSIGPCTTLPIAAIIPEYFATAFAAKKHALGRIPIGVGVSQRRCYVPGQAILEACSRETEQLVYQIGRKLYVSTTRGIILQYSPETQAPEMNLEIDPLETYEILVEDIEKVTQRVAQL